MRASPWAIAALAAALAAVPESSAQTSVYKWIDADGKVQFSDMPPPPSVTKNVTEKRMGGGAVDSSQLPYALQMAMKNNPVTLYTASQCGPLCDQGRALLGDRGIPYTERNAQGSQADADAVKKAVGSLTVPVLIVGGDAIKGFEPGQWNGALDAAGYPRTPLPGSLKPKPVVIVPPPPAPAPDAPDAASELPK